MTALRIAIRDLVADGKRSALSIAAVAPIVAAFLVLMGIAEGLRSEAIDTTGQSVVILSPNSLDPAGGRLDPSVLVIAAEVAGPNASGVSPLIFRPIKVDETILQLRAAPLEDWGPVHRLTLLDGRLPGLDADEIAVTEGVAAATGWAMGDPAEIYGTTFTVTGLVRASGTKFASVWMSFDRAERLFEGATGFQMAMVHPAPGASVEVLRADLGEALGDSYGVYFESEVASQQTSRLDVADELATLAILVGGAALGFGSFNLTALTVAERRRDLGIARSLGFSATAIGAVAVLRSLLLSTAGFVLGGAVAWGFLSSVGTRTLRSFVVDVAVPTAAWPGGLLLCLFVTAIGSGLAVGTASRSRIRSLVETS